MQRGILLITALVLSTAWPAAAANIVADWQGTLKVGSAELHLVLQIAQGSDGALKANLDIVDRGANGIAVTSIALEHSRLTFTVESAHSYHGSVIFGGWPPGVDLYDLLVKAAYIFLADSASVLSCCRSATNSCWAESLVRASSP